MTDHEGWSEPEIWVKGRSFVPRTLAEDREDRRDRRDGGDPPDVSDSGHSAWSPPTMAGKERRPRTPRREEPAEPPEVAPGGAPGHPADPESTGADTGNRALLAHSRTMAIASLVSRVTGFLRGSALAAAIGVGAVGDAYNVANTLPNMVYELLLGGVLSSVLIPLLVRAQQDDEDDGVAYMQRLLSLATAALGVITVLAVLAAPLFADVFAPAGAQRSLTSLFASLLLPEIFFYGVGAMLMAVLNVRHSYAPGAWAPVLNNVTLLVTVGVFLVLPGPNTLTPSSMTNTQVLVLGIGTTLGIALQAAVLVPALRRTGFDWQWRFRARPNELGRMRAAGSLAGWVIAYVVVSQIGVAVIARVGTSNHAFTIFTYADLLIQMPYGILVVSLLTAIMPRLSRAAAQEDTAAVVSDIDLGARLSAVTLLPIAALLCVLGPSVGVTLLGYGVTSVDGARLIGTALAASAFGLFPFAVVMLELRVFYAMHDGRTPWLINVWMVGTKVVLVLIGAQLFDGPGHIGETLTVSTSASYVVGAVVGFLRLRRRLGAFDLGGVGRTVSRVLVASVAAALVAAVLASALTGALGHGHGGSLATLVVGGVVGLVVYGVLAWRLRVDEIRDLARVLRR